MVCGRPVQAMLQSYGVATELVELQNLITVGSQVMEAALKRKESRGGHYNVDHPPRRLESAPPAKPVPHPRSSSGPKLQRKPERLRKEKDLGLTVRGCSPPRSRPVPRDVIFRSQSDDQK